MTYNLSESRESYTMKSSQFTKLFKGFLVNEKIILLRFLTNFCHGESKLWNMD